MNLILFGPPGIGKSTLIGALKSSGARAVDLEDVYPSRVRFQLPSQVDNVVLGGADLDPKRVQKNVKRVLLTMPEQEYMRRRARRDSLQPGKKDQQLQSVAQWRDGVTYDYEVDVTAPINAVVQQIRTIMRKEAML